MKFGQNDALKAQMLQMIIDELLEQSGDLSFKDNIKEQGNGAYSTTYKVGNYVIKFGEQRKNETVPNHIRILQSIIRIKFPKIYGMTNDEASFIEVQNEVDAKWYYNMDYQEIEKILFQIYSELRDDGLIWLDVKLQNVGKLLKTNTSRILYVDIDGKTKQIIPNENENGLIGEIKEKPLEKEKYVIIDNDYIIREGEIETIGYSPGQFDRMLKYEVMYQNKKKKDKPKEI